MDSLLTTLRSRQEKLVERGRVAADATRQRGVDTLGALRNGALDWRRTLDAHRKELEARSPRWLAVRLRVVDRIDGVLNVFGDRVRREIERLSRLELASSGSAEEPKSSAKTKAGGSRATKGKTAKAKAKAKSTKAKAAKPKAAKAKSSRAKAAAKTARTKKQASASRRLVMPIGDYDQLSAKQVLAELPTLTAAQCKVVLEHEKSRKNRKTVLKALAARTAA